MQSLLIVIRFLTWIFSPVVERHIAIGCDITEIYQNGQSLDMYLVKTSLLIELIETRQETGYTCMKDVVNNETPYTLCSYEYPYEVFTIDSIQSYYVASMKMLYPFVWENYLCNRATDFHKSKG